MIYLKDSLNYHLFNTSVKIKKSLQQLFWVFHYSNSIIQKSHETAEPLTEG